MTNYEAAMNRLKLESVMAWALHDMWEHAEEGDFEAAMHWQFVYLFTRDEWLNPRGGGGAASLYWQLKQVATFGGLTHEF